MSPIEAFLALLRSWRDRGAVVFDADEVAAPHAAVTAFDLGAFGATAEALRTDSALVGDTLRRVAGVRAEVPLSWTGTGADALVGASTRILDDLAPAAEALAIHARMMSAAHLILGEVIDDYRSAMTEAAEPLAVTMSTGEARTELGARLDLVHAAGTAASRAVNDGIGVLHRGWRSPGELVLAGER
ncbi:MAG: hypothetical protein QM809_18205 [Gordonia sp. (in: high G+C Gram-positive bacteria)]|uniref:hypothetical protein n=1 Tax=Gordonia sp. (in: high G+C Gram-positive bacteria) TaxID=84139 RepID=UPI0039E5F61D